MEAFKNAFNEKLVGEMSQHFKNQWPEFDSRAFTRACTQDLHNLELKERSLHITHNLQKYMPKDFNHAARILLNSLGTELDDDLSLAKIDRAGIAGWAIMPMSHFVALNGLNHFELSMNLLKEMTKRFTAEFAIRFFIIKERDKTLAQLNKWAKDKNQHVRRLVSEGSRPRLPWAMRLPEFIKNPQPVIDLLDQLRDDKKEYVRRSVANNLNDIAKDHPQLVSEIASTWMKDASEQRKKLVRHACRSLLKDGHGKTLRVFGFKPPKIHKVKLKINAKTILLGDVLQFDLEMMSNSNQTQELMIDYKVHHKKANGETSPKVFKWRVMTLRAGEGLSISKKHVIKKVTTRKYYSGGHKLEILINGQSFATKKFELIV